MQLRDSTFFDSAFLLHTTKIHVGDISCIVLYRISQSLYVYNILEWCFR
jgi:predicted Abi (CAAX) family protease